MKRLYLSVAALALSAALAGAQDMSQTFRGTADAMEIHASELIGKRIYRTDTALDRDTYDSVQQDWEDIGEINDIILTRYLDQYEEVMTDEEVDARTRLLDLADNPLMDLLLGRTELEGDVDLPHVRALLACLRQT